MNLSKYLQGVVEHKDVPLYKNQDIPLFLARRFISHISPAHAMILNNLLNTRVWDDANKNTRLRVLQICTPKSNFNYNVLFGNYTKAPKKDNDSKYEKVVDFVSNYFDISKAKARQCLDDRPELRPLVEKELSKK